MLKLDKDKKYLLACSFGPDSMALFHMLITEGYNFEVAHVNYGLRKEAKLETQGLVSYCKENNIVLHIKKVNKKEIKKNTEEACRKIRYAFFANLIKEDKSLNLLVAHNEDDLIETYIMQKRRRNFPMYYGIAETSHIFGVDVTRPLLSHTKDELSLYCVKNYVPYAIDSSNLLDVFLRNRIRHNIVSKLTKSERKIIIKEINEKNSKLADIFKKISKISTNDIISIINLSDEELCYFLNMKIKEKIPSKSLSRLACLELKKMLISKKSNIVFPLTKRISFIKSYSSFHFEINKKVYYEIVIKEPSKVDNKFFYLDFTKDSSNRNVSNDDYPLTIRPFKPGDLYNIKNYMVKVNRLYIDWKMPIALRRRWPLIINNKGDVIYIPRYREDFKKTENINFFVK